MKKTWLNKRNHKKLILFFNGWGMDSYAVEHLETTGFDVVEFNDYKTIQFSEREYSGYDEIYVVAWSLGIWAAASLLNNFPIKIEKAIAINGTLNPVHPEMGIQPTIFKGTIHGWNEKNRKRFMMRVAGGKAQFETNISRFGERTTENQQEELISLYDQMENRKTIEFEFDTAVIGRQDAIFIPDNQDNYWKEKASITHFDMPHYPFLQFTSWEEIIKL